MQQHLFLKRLSRWIAGFFAAGIILWGIGWIFLSSPTMYEHNSQLDLVVPKAGTFKQERDENWVTSHFGDWGLEKNDSRKIVQGDVKTVIIGDSYIEANMIPPEQRMQHWVGDDAIGIGFSGFDFDDYLEILPKYLKYAPNVENIVIFMGDIYDIVPASRKNTVFQKVSTHADYISYRYHLYSFRRLYRKFRLHEWDFIGNKRVSAVSEMEHVVWDTTTQVYLQQQLERLNDIAENKSILIVYAPQIPNITGNQIILDDSQQEYIDHFSSLCQDEKIKFINLGPLFIREYFERKCFPRGFFNTPVGQGHLNEFGHRLAGETIRRFIRDRIE